MVETDAIGRVALPGYENQRFLVHELSNGSVFLEPARVVSQTQREYGRDPALRELLARAAASSTVRRLGRIAES